MCREAMQLRPLAVNFADVAGLADCDARHELELMDPDDDISPNSSRPRSTNRVIAINLAIQASYTAVSALVSGEFILRGGLGLGFVIFWVPLSIVHALVCAGVQVGVTALAKRDPSSGWIASAVLVFLIPLLTLSLVDVHTNW